MPDPLAKLLPTLRREYERAGLREEDALAEPIGQFERWMSEALAAGVVEANAMTLATASPDGAPDARIVLLKGVDAHGFTFFTNYDSAKGHELAANPRASLVFLWRELARQVRITGSVTRVTREESEDYFASRPRGSQLGAWASAQSSRVDSRAALDVMLAQVTARFAGADVPCPPHWGGYRVAPDAVEFWQGRESRMHDRLRYVREATAWRRERLAP
jgi:pyridoxamine 5'-phosphate oxidase